jgi:hypothetical protein
MATQVHCIVHCLYLPVSKFIYFHLNKFVKHIQCFNFNYETLKNCVFQKISVLQIFVVDNIILCILQEVIVFLYYISLVIKTFRNEDLSR